MTIKLKGDRTENSNTYVYMYVCVCTHIYEKISNGIIQHIILGHLLSSVSRKVI